MDHSAPNMLNIFDINKYMVSTFVYKCVKGRIYNCEDWFCGPIETFTDLVYSSLGDPLFVPQYLVMHSRQSILYREPKIYNDVVPMEI